jgi:type IV secretory pathway VirB4 component
MVDDGIILLKDGSFCADMQYQGLDMHSMGAEDGLQLRIRINQTLCQLGDGWMLHADMIRRKVRGVVFIR